MKRDGGFLQAYNAQIAVAKGHQIIVAAALSNQAGTAATVAMVATVATAA